MIEIVRHHDGSHTGLPKELEMRPYRKRPVVIHAAQINEPFVVETLEGLMRGNAGDWLLCGVLGELYPCKPDVFAVSYEQAGEFDDCT